MGFVHALVVVVLNAASLQVATSTPDILALLEAGDEARVVDQIRGQPDETRAAVTRLFGLSVRAALTEGRV